MKDREPVSQDAKVIDITGRLAQKREEDSDKEYPKLAKIIILDREREKRMPQPEKILFNIGELSYKKELTLKLVTPLKSGEYN